MSLNVTPLDQLKDQSLPQVFRYTTVVDTVAAHEEISKLLDIISTSGGESTPEQIVEIKRAYSIVSAYVRGWIEYGQYDTIVDILQKQEVDEITPEQAKAIYEKGMAERAAKAEAAEKERKLNEPSTEETAAEWRKKIESRVTELEEENDALTNALAISYSENGDYPTAEASEKSGDEEKKPEGKKPESKKSEEKKSGGKKSGKVNDA